MPMGRGRDGDDINIFAFQNPAEIRVAGLVIRRADPFHIALGHVANRQPVEAAEIAKGAGPAPANADEGGPEGFARRGVVGPA